MNEIRKYKTQLNEKIFELKEEQDKTFQLQTTILKQNDKILVSENEPDIKMIGELNGCYMINAGELEILKNKLKEREESVERLLTDKKHIETRNIELIYELDKLKSNNKELEIKKEAADIIYIRSENEKNKYELEEIKSKNKILEVENES